MRNIHAKIINKWNFYIQNHYGEWLMNTSIQPRHPTAHILPPALLLFLLDPVSHKGKVTLYTEAESVWGWSGFSSVPYCSSGLSLLLWSFLPLWSICIPSRATHSVRTPIPGRGPFFAQGCMRTCTPLLEPSKKLGRSDCLHTNPGIDWCVLYS